MSGETKQTIEKRNQELEKELSSLRAENIALMRRIYRAADREAHPDRYPIAPRPPVRITLTIDGGG